jgi:hypothetical protein
MDIFGHLSSIILIIFTAFSGPKNPVDLPKLPTPSPTPIFSDADYINRDGSYSYSGQTLKYVIHIPKKGGAVTGQFSEVCHGPITGTYNTVAESVEGIAKATCPILLNKKLEAFYTSHFDWSKGKAYINWSGDIPYTEGHGGFTMDFEPVK